MHPDARAYLDKIADEDTRARFTLFMEAFDAMDRENTHLRLAMQERGHCPYGHFTGAGCRLGYPGCACMDDLMALTAWSPEDEDKAAVRIGRLLFETRRLLDNAQQTLVGAALRLEKADPELASVCRKAAAERVSVTT